MLFRSLPAFLISVKSDPVFRVSAFKVSMRGILAYIYSNEKGRHLTAPPGIAWRCNGPPFSGCGPTPQLGLTSSSALLSSCFRKKDGSPSTTLFPTLLGVTVPLVPISFCPFGACVFAQFEIKLDSLWGSRVAPENF